MNKHENKVKVQVKHNTLMIEKIIIYLRENLKMGCKDKSLLMKELKIFDNYYGIMAIDNNTGTKFDDDKIN